MLRKLLGSLAIAAAVAVSYIHDGVAAETAYAPQVSDARGIKVTVILQHIKKEAKTWDFEVTLETHTKALNEDLSESSVLLVDGKQYMFLGWEGTPPGGHHRKGLLRFKAIEQQPRSLELQLRLAGETSPRSFKWLLK
ncbi:MAG: hypothetical protein WCT35_11650 [Sideroxydans sp.]|jgi:hypothetical protein